MTDATWAPGDRASVIKRDDNLQPEGEFSKRLDTSWAPGERANVVRRVDNLQLEGKFSRSERAQLLGKEIIYNLRVVLLADLIVCGLQVGLSML